MAEGEGGGEGDGGMGQLIQYNYGTTCKNM